VNVDDLFGALGAIPRLEGSLCVGRHELFDLRDISDPDRAEAEARALALCGTCPAALQCRQWVERLPASRRPHGVIAGEVRRPPAPRKPRVA
jgi:hypothetical protein